MFSFRLLCLAYCFADSALSAGIHLRCHCNTLTLGDRLPVWGRMGRESFTSENSLSRILESACKQMKGQTHKNRKKVYLEYPPY